MQSASFRCWISFAVLLAPIAAQSEPHTIQFLGVGTVVNDMNRAGEVVGWGVSTAGVVEGYVVAPGRASRSLPLLPGFQSAWAQGINDAGVVVGSTSTGSLPEFGVPCAWYPDGNGGYQVQLLPLLPSSTQGVAYAINNRSDIVGSSFVSGFGGGPTVWFNSPTGLRNLETSGAPSSPKQINDEGVIVGINGGLFDIDTMTAAPLPVLPSGWTGFQGWAINERGELAGTAIHGSRRSAAIWTLAGGWQSISLQVSQSAQVQAFDIDDAGRATAETPAPSLARPGAGVVTLISLLASTQQQQWSLAASFGNAINDAGQIATIGSNSATGQTGVVLLTPPGCQANLGAAGPGSVSATFCGSGLDAGETSDSALAGGPSLASAALLISLAGAADVQVFGGTLVDFGGFVASAPLTLSTTGRAQLAFAGFANPQFDLVFQTVCIDPLLPQGIAFSNAILARFGR